MIRENHPSGASGKKYGLATMDEHPALSRIFGNQSKSVSLPIVAIAHKNAHSISMGKNTLERKNLEQT